MENFNKTHTLHMVAWISSVVLLSVMIGCAGSKPPYLADTKILLSKQFSSQYPPRVHVRLASSEEIKQISEFPGKKDQELLAQLDGAGSLLLAPALLVCFFPEFLNPDNWHFKQDPGIKEALEKFTDRLTRAIEYRFLVLPAGKGPSVLESRDLLEVVYYADVPVIGPAADRVCFVVHAQITLLANDSVLYREIIRIDPRAFNRDIKQPDCTTSPDIILNCADEVIPDMIQNRLPGLPWKPPLP